MFPSSFCLLQIPVREKSGSPSMRQGGRAFLYGTKGEQNQTIYIAFGISFFKMYCASFFSFLTKACNSLISS